LLFFKTDASELKKSIDLGKLVEGIHEHCFKEVVCFKIIMQHACLCPSSAIRALKTLFWNTVLAALNIFSSVVID
jgi:hypothetical protein